MRGERGYTWSALLGDADVCWKVPGAPLQAHVGQHRGILHEQPTNGP